MSTLKGETSIVYDYEIREVRIYSDRESVLKGIQRRVGGMEGVRIDGKFAYIPMKYCRGAQFVTKVLSGAIVEPEEGDEAEESVA